MPFFPIIYQNAGNNIFSKIWKENSYKICESSIKNYQIDVLWYLQEHFLLFLFLQLVDVSEWSGNDNTSNVRLIFNNKWRPGVTVSSLIIQKVNSSHNGVFQCIPSNSEPKEIKVHVLKGMVLLTTFSDINEINSNFSKIFRWFEACCDSNNKS